MRAEPYITFMVLQPACIAGSLVSLHHAFQFATSSIVNDQSFVDHMFRVLV